MRGGKDEAVGKGSGTTSDRCNTQEAAIDSSGQQIIMPTSVYHQPLYFTRSDGPDLSSI